MSQTKLVTLTGGCQCGKKRYRIQGSIVEPTAVCYCRMCQKAMGYRLFCSQCGTPLAFLPIDEKTIELTVGSLDQPQGMAPMEQTGTESQIDWIKTIFDLPARTTYENQTETIDLINYQHPDHD